MQLTTLASRDFSVPDGVETLFNGRETNKNARNPRRREELRAPARVALVEAGELNPRPRHPNAQKNALLERQAAQNPAHLRTAMMTLPIF
jgi:hypothetical protein